MTLDICIVTVTYGKRWLFLEQVIDRSLSFSEVSKIIIVDNASDYDVLKASVCFNDPRVTVIREAENTGSAGGYAAGIAYAEEHTNADLIWLLDDDNVPARNAAAELLSAWDEIPGGSREKALFCFRQDRLVHRRIAKGQDPYNYYLVPDNFMGFHVLRMIKNKIRKATIARIDRQPIKRYVEMPYVPYGGFMFHREMINKIGLPNASLFVYADDSEYTYRVTASGGRILLVSAATITDVDPSQGNNYRTGLMQSPLLELWNFRTYYQVRNRIFFYSRNSVRHFWLYKLNQVLFMSGLYLKALFTGKMKEYYGVKTAVKHGHKGLLGKVESMPGTAFV